MIEGKKWFCWRYDQPRELAVLMDDCGKIKYFMDDNDGEFYNIETSSMAKGEVFFDTEAEAQRYYEENTAIFKQNAVKIKDYLNYLNDIGGEVELEEFVPAGVIHSKQPSFSYAFIQRKLEFALQGIINVAGISIFKDKIKYIKWVSRTEATMVLDVGDEIKITDSDDYLFLTMVFPK